MVTSLEYVKDLATGVGERQAEVWRLILDHVFADAALSEIGTLRLVMPEGLFSDSVAVRCELVGSTAGNRTAVAWLVPRYSRSVSADKAYVLRTPLRWVEARIRQDDAKAGWVCRDTWFVYPWETWLLGFAMRMFGRLGWPEWQDRALFALRPRLVGRTMTWCAYVLTVYERRDDGTDCRQAELRSLSS